ncbi:PTS sugar transporter subunit IIB [uncultured Clostridium sp.]|uniref:PTS sugar transporter subunit IIB n=1 Tax=uncultured Clostridium sp. TaxID=59620 RepID=UPI0028E18B63|nr:PTS sugar transporter subunit IIB [uncultured Clostridium sp.]
MKGILFVGHGDLPHAIKKSVEMIIGENEDLFSVSLSLEDGKDEFMAKLNSIEPKLAKYDKIIVFSDLIGGSPNNGTLEKFINDSRVEIISGMNLPMVLTTALSEDNIAKIIQEGRNGINSVKNPIENITQESKSKNDVQPKTKIDGRPYVIKNVRVDSRGIHGQVATAWVPHLDVDRIIVIDDIAIKDETQKIALKMAKPNSVKLSILSTSKAKERLEDKNSYLDEDILVIIQRIETLKKLSDIGYKFDQVNLGNVPNRPGTKSYGKTIHLTIEEVEIIKKLIDGGTNFTAQMVPNNSKIDFNEIIKK